MNEEQRLVQKCLIAVSDKKILKSEFAGTSPALGSVVAVIAECDDLVPLLAAVQLESPT